MIEAGKRIEFQQVLHLNFRTCQHCESRIGVGLVGRVMQQLRRTSGLDAYQVPVWPIGLFGGVDL